MPHFKFVGGGLWCRDGKTVVAGQTVELSAKEYETQPQLFEPLQSAPKAKPPPPAETKPGPAVRPGPPKPQGGGGQSSRGR